MFSVLLLEVTSNQLKLALDLKTIKNTIEFSSLEFQSFEKNQIF
jgi:hypothetical protein